MQHLDIETPCQKNRLILDILLVLVTLSWIFLFLPMTLTCLSPKPKMMLSLHYFDPNKCNNRCTRFDVLTNAQNVCVSVRGSEHPVQRVRRLPTAALHHV